MTGHSIRRRGVARALAAAAVLTPVLALQAATGVAMAEETPSPSPSASESASTSPSGSAEEYPGLTPINGGQKRTEAATVTNGSYLDHAEPHATWNLYKFERTIPRSTINFGVTLLGDDVKPSQRLYALLLWTAEGPTEGDDDDEFFGCGRARYVKDKASTSMPIATQGGFSFEWEKCRDKPHLYLLVQSRKGGDVAEGAPYQVDFWEEPEVTNLTEDDRTSWSEWLLDDADAPQLKAEARDTKSEAVPIPSGQTVAVDLPLGRPAWFKVNMAAGQYLQAIAETPDGGSVAGAAMEMRIVSPVGGFTERDFNSYQQPAASAINLAAGPGLVTNLSDTLSPANRIDQAGSYGHTQALSSLPGEYYVVVYVQKIAGTPVETLPVTVRATAIDHPSSAGYIVPKKPVYDGTFAPAELPGGPAPAPYTEPVMQPSAPRTGGRTMTDWVLVGGLAAGALVFALAGFGLLRSRS